MKNLLFIVILCLLFTGCVQKKCECLNVNCGEKCRLQCEENKCTPGEKCCDKCTCDPFKK